MEFSISIASGVLAVSINRPYVLGKMRQKMALGSIRPRPWQSCASVLSAWNGFVCEHICLLGIECHLMVCLDEQKPNWRWWWYHTNTHHSNNFLVVVNAFNSNHYTLMELSNITLLQGIPSKQILKWRLFLARFPFHFLAILFLFNANNNKKMEENYSWLWYDYIHPFIIGLRGIKQTESGI